ncbi:MAG: metallophosphoesterase [Crocinitomicaceae bacterium]|nr:metallophosphoesterase [Crocinitomicaceae bacterium]
MNQFFTSIVLLCMLNFYHSQELVQPFLQNLSSNKVTIVWESSTCDSGTLEWGNSNLINSSPANSIQTSNSCIFSVTIQNLSPNTIYSYRTVNDSYTSKLLSFKTPDLQSNESLTRFIAMSDMQKDNSHPDVFEKLINDGVLNYFDNNYVGSLNQNLQMVLIPGDLVDNGNNHNEWIDDFFDAGKNLFSYVPIYPVLGNHEQNSSYFFDYFDLPKNGSVNYKEHWWYKDQSNIRIIGLNSNWDYQIQLQLNWLDSVLQLTSDDTLIDFVFVQLHHPHHSELWPEGNTDFTGDVIEKLETFSDNSGKPSVHFFGHTHGYSRGQSKEHKHLMVNVASAGGNIDYWDEYYQEDYEEYTISQDEYGFVLVEVTAGENPYFVMKRFSLGDQFDEKNNVLQDSISIKLNAEKPNRPIAIYPTVNSVVSPDGFTLQGSTFIDSDNDGHGASHWQISLDSLDFNDLIIDHWIQYQNIYKEIDLQNGVDLSKHQINTLWPNNKFYWRFRYRDKGLNWSEWSETESFNTDSIFKNWNLYPNPTYENITLHIPFELNRKFEVSVHNQNGSLVKNYDSIYPPVLRINTVNLKKGVYILTIYEYGIVIKSLKFNVLK